MKKVQASLKLMISGAVVVAALAIADLSASAQTGTTSTTTPTAPTTLSPLTPLRNKPTSASDQMVQEACQRQKARTEKFKLLGVPEKFGSEEPFTFDPKAPPC
jgi:ABC-type transport system substrate-binding protein